MAHYIMQMEDVTKLYGQRVIVQDITLSFYYGAKIGMLGKNGTGKSTHLRIMAGEDTDFDGKVWHHTNCRIGHVSQEPVVDLTKTVRQTVEEGVADRVAMLEEYEHLCATSWELPEDEQAMSIDYLSQFFTRAEDEEKMLQSFERRCL